MAVARAPKEAGKPLQARPLHCVSIRAAGRHRLSQVSGGGVAQRRLNSSVRSCSCSAHLGGDVHSCCVVTFVILALHRRQPHASSRRRGSLPSARRGWAGPSPARTLCFNASGSVSTCTIAGGRSEACCCLEGSPMMASSKSVPAHREAQHQGGYSSWNRHCR